MDTSRTDPKRKLSTGPSRFFVKSAHNVVLCFSYPRDANLTTSQSRMYVLESLTPSLHCSSTRILYGDGYLEGVCAAVCWLQATFSDYAVNTRSHLRVYLPVLSLQRAFDDLLATCLSSTHSDRFISVPVPVAMAYWSRRRCEKR